jgi:hypothetical protein
MLDPGSMPTRIHPTLEEMQKFEIERRKKDNVDDLLSKDGFYDRRHGRDGYIYYVENGRLCEMYYELSCVKDYDINFFPIDLREWLNPKGTKIAVEHQLRILCNLRQWLTNENIKSSVDLPSELTITDQSCVWANCNEHKIKGFAICLHHYNLSFLVE